MRTSSSPFWESRWPLSLPAICGGFICPFTLCHPMSELHVFVAFRISACEAWEYFEHR